ncbi:uncharacterized protein [Chelonus insularis]|uniref:uncharacterized protein n=1 Tax=Chelonus insularis TaxID=460826 RepID=UPI00158DAEEA|nr:uncharacterized protein LOC118069724 [Chelonus insularis]
MLKKFKNSIWNFHSDFKFLMNISERKWHKCLVQPINMTDDFKVDVPEEILGCESFVEVMNLVNSLNFFAPNKEFNLLLPERRTEELSYQSRMLFSSDNSIKETNLNVIRDADQPDDISAWQEVSMRTREHLKKLAEMAAVPLKVKEKNIIKFSILPEPPNPKKDVAIVKASDIEKLTSLKKILDPAILSDQNDELPTARIILHEFDPEEKLDSTQKISDEPNKIIFDQMKVQILNDPNSIIPSSKQTQLIIIDG